MADDIVYYLASRFPTHEAASPVYHEVQELIRTTDCELSAFCAFTPDELDQPWLVIVIGEVPAAALHQTLLGILKRGDLTTLPGGALLAFYERRLQQIKKHPGTFSEGHYGRPADHGSNDHNHKHKRR